MHYTTKQVLPILKCQ